VPEKTACFNLTTQASVCVRIGGADEQDPKDRGGWVSWK